MSAEDLLREGDPPAPSIGGDSHEVAAWLRRLRDYRAPVVEEYCAIDEVHTLFVHANPEAAP